MKNCIYGAAIFIAACFSCTSPKAKECVVEGEVKGYGDGFFCVMTETLDDYDVDTVEVKNGHFTYRSSIEHPTQLTLLHATSGVLTLSVCLPKMQILRFG